MTVMKATIPISAVPADNDLLQFDSATGLWTPSTTVDGITLGTPWTLDGNGSWTGDWKIWDLSSGAKLIQIKDNASAAFDILISSDYFKVSFKFLTCFALRDKTSLLRLQRMSSLVFANSYSTKY